jgi:uncharacterized protein YbjT (DUF2867 family)
MPTVLLTGASGFVGGRLHDPLVDAGFEVRCLSRRPEAAAAKRPRWTWIGGDVGNATSLISAMEGCDLAYFLVHAMSGAEPGWKEREFHHATLFAEAAEKAALKRIIYLGGIAPTGTPSDHLRTRLEVGRLLRAGRVPCLELRASMIIGHGSASWRMVRDLAVRLPAMVLPAWLKHRTEPVGIDDVIGALIRSATLPLPSGHVEDLPGPELLSGREILIRVAALVGHRPVIVEVPFVTPRLSSYWIRLVSGVDYKLARELVEGLTSDIVARQHDFWERAQLPPPERLEVAARRALAEDTAEEPRTLQRLERVLSLLSRPAARTQ